MTHQTIVAKLKTAIGGSSVRRFSERIGQPRASVMNTLNRRHRPRLDRIIQMAEALGYTVELVKK